MVSSGKPSGLVVLRTLVLSGLCLEPHVTGPKSVSHGKQHREVLFSHPVMVAEKGSLWSHTVCESRTVQMNFSH